jgi:hypothetical protein
MPIQPIDNVLAAHVNRGLAAATTRLERNQAARDPDGETEKHSHPGLLREDPARFASALHPR